MKKFIALLLAAVMMLSFTGCANNDIIAKIKNFNLVDFLNKEPDWNKVKVDELLTGSPVKYYFNRLGNKEKQAYNDILSKIDTMPDSIEIPSLNQTELTTVFEALLYDNPYLFFLGRSCTITKRGLKNYFNAQYIMTASQYSKKKKQLQDKANAIIAALGKKSQLETEFYIHNFIVNNCSYENNGNDDESTAYGALINKKAACEGYSKAAKVLFDIAGIECYVVSGMSENFQGKLESHMWNIVKINGNYYHLDLTWDDPVTLGQSSLNDPRYTYFNVTDKEISKTHSGFHSTNACTAAAANYYVFSGLYFTGYNAAVQSQLAEKLAASINKGGSKIEFKFSSPAVYSQAFKGLFGKQQVYDIINVANRSTSKDLSKLSVSYVQNKDFNIIELIVK
jgi:hypothetical protein